MRPIASPFDNVGGTAQADGTGAGERHQASGRHKQRLGRQGEILAAAHLRRLGFRVLERNWRCDAGEIDIVASDGPVVVGCEVKTRSGHTFGSPQEGVDDEKLARLYRLIHRWAVDRDHAFPDVRVDVIGVLLAPGRRPRIEHLMGVC